MGKKNGKIYVKGKYYKYKGKILFFKGEVYNYDEVQVIFDLIIQHGIDVVSDLKGEFFIIYYDINLNKIYFANDKLGRETLFYFYNQKHLILSDDFWEIVNLINPNTSDIDIQSIKEFAIFYYPLFFKTIIKNLNFFPPASRGEFSLKDFKLKIKEYWDFKYNPDEKIDIKTAADRLDYLFNNAIKYIKTKNPSNTVYGVGLSGGLDSRLIPYYALKNNMTLKSFIIGEKRPHIFFLSRDHKSARKIAKYYNLIHHEISYNSETFQDKSFYDIRYNPTGTSNFFIGLQNTLPEFNVLLTGMNGGEFLGTLIPNNINKLNKKELLDTIIKTFSYMYSNKKKNLIEKFYSFLDIIFKSNKLKNNQNKKIVDEILNKNEIIEIRSKIWQFIENNADDKTNIEIFQKYLFWHLISKNKYGTFATLYGTKKSYGLFTNPDIVEEMLRLNLKFILNRQLQIYFYKKKFSKLAKIPHQGYNVPIYYYNNSSIFRKAAFLIIYFIRGSGMRYTNWGCKKRYKKYSHKILLKKSYLFSNIFDIKNIFALNKKNPRLYENLVKIKQILDLIETKGYKIFLGDQET